ncbi:Pr6Pr family membrane protein [Altererythrobacter arenosus]|uniref:Pr6Pr family membrane protein n=1 Tax=Altererythrobacter arenosus TaxID=3032592 RepID=A0ABY8FM05_9SPHN|nr:Pr6Pr family membrane protein [Altererythrobacter sp. CAU 1644]WFL76050.1 Pr6Pr family membrane protein [Altererythrobacter sp. CAU 1644]
MQTTINDDRDGSALVAFALLFRFFTIWSNFAAGLVMGWIASGRHIPRAALFALATALTIVALVYWALLAADHHPVGLDWWTNLAFHGLIPAGVIGWWMVVTRHDAARWALLPFVMIAPVIYTMFALGYGELTGFYAYFFLDKSALGWGQLLANIAGLALFFMAMGAALMGIRSLVGRGPRPSVAA